MLRYPIIIYPTAANIRNNFFPDGSPVPNPYHAEATATAKPKAKTASSSFSVCLDYLKGQCKRAQCRYEHPDMTHLQNELGEQQGICEVYAMTGRCKFGSKCNKLHPGSRRRAGPTEPATHSVLPANATIVSATPATATVTPQFSSITEDPTLPPMDSEEDFRNFFDSMQLVTELPDEDGGSEESESDEERGSLLTPKAGTPTAKHTPRPAIFFDTILWDILADLHLVAF